MDPALSRYVSAATDAEAQRHLSDLLTTIAQPVIVRALARLAPSAEIPDLRAQTLMLLVDRLRAVRAGGERIAEFRAYVSAVARHVAQSWLRSHRPNRTRMGYKVRYLIENDPVLAGWAGEGSQRALPPNVGQDLAERPLRDALVSLRERVPGPVSLGGLVTLVCEIYGVCDEEARDCDVDTAGAREFDVAAHIDRVSALRLLWAEIQELPVRQRYAILLHLEGIEHLPATGIASFREIASALEISVEDLGELWSRLPLEDREIAGRIGVERQQVINLRKSARERLNRRLAARFGEAVITVVVVALLHWAIAGEAL